MRKSLGEMLLAVGLGLSGFAILFHVDWRIAVGVFLFAWGNNISTHRD